MDSIIVGISTAVLGFLTDMAGFFNWLSFPFVMGLIYVLYFTIAESTFGYTVGKRIVNLKVSPKKDTNQVCNALLFEISVKSTFFF